MSEQIDNDTAERAALREIVDKLAHFRIGDDLPRQGEGTDVYRKRLASMNINLFNVYRIAENALNGHDERRKARPISS